MDQDNATAPPPLDLSKTGGDSVKEKPDRLAQVATAIQVVSVVVGVVLSVWGFLATQRKEAEARRIDAAKPFLELRQSRYSDVLKQAAILSNPQTHSADEISAARKRFRELYVADLSMVEVPSVEAQMIDLAKQIDPDVTMLTPAQTAAYRLAHALRDSLMKSYGIEQ